MEAELLEAMYSIMIRYVPAKDRQAVADHVVDRISELSPDEELLVALAEVDKYLKAATNYHVDFSPNDDE
jgi:hypothetical protein